MLLYKFKKQLPNPKITQETGVTGYYWVFEAGFDRNCWFYIGFDHRIEWADESRSGGRYYNLTISWNRWEWGRTHMYYDGPHDSFSLGFLHFNWSGDWCGKCVEAG